MAMSMRSRGAAVAARRSRTGAQPVYEDFKPKSELEHEEGADILLYHLPGFAKEQIRIIAESKGLLRVRGERLLADNKWSRFHEDVVVREDCNLNQVRAKFEDDILKIIMPKNTKIETKQPTIAKEAAKLPEPLSSNAKHTSINQNPQLSKDDLASNSTPPNNNIEKSQQTLEGVKESQPKNLHDNKTNIESKEDGHKETSKSVNKHKNKKSGNNVGNLEKDDVNKHNNESNGFANMKNLTKGHAIRRRLDEDRQHLVNMGAAILVIMALGASISYSLLGSS